MSSVLISSNSLAVGCTSHNDKISLTASSSSVEKPFCNEKDPSTMDDTTSTTCTDEDPAVLQEEAKIKNLDYIMTDEEVQGVKEMLQALTDEEKASLADPYMPLRHFRAEKADVAKAITAIRHTLKWRKEFDVDSIVGMTNGMREIMHDELTTGKMYVRGHDKDGRACLYMRPGRENTHVELNNMRHLVFQLEKAIACTKGHSKICLIIDYEGFRLRDAPPMSTSKYTLEILQRHYPERLHRAYVCNPPWVFTTFWTVIKPFVDPVTKSKICFCSGKAGMDKIADDMGPNGKYHLEKCAGGAPNSLPRDFDYKEYLKLPMHISFDEEAIPAPPAVEQR